MSENYTNSQSEDLTPERRAELREFYRGMEKKYFPGLNSTDEELDDMVTRLQTPGIDGETLENLRTLERRMGIEGE